MSAKIKIYGAMLREREFTAASLASAARVNVRTARTVIQRVPPAWLLESAPRRNAKGAPSNVYVVSNTGFDEIRRYLLDHVPQEPDFPPGREMAEYERDFDPQLSISAAKAFMAKVPALIANGRLAAAESLLAQADSQIAELKQLGALSVEQTKGVLELQLTLVTLRMQSFSVQQPSTRFEEAERILSYSLENSGQQEAERILSESLGGTLNKSSLDVKFVDAVDDAYIKNSRFPYLSIGLEVEPAPQAALANAFNNFGLESGRAAGLVHYPSWSGASRVFEVPHHIRVVPERLDSTRHGSLYEESHEPLFHIAGAWKDSKHRWLLQEPDELSRPLKSALARIEHDSMVHPKRSLKVLVVSANGQQTDISATNVSTLLKTSLLNYVDVTPVYSTSLAQRSWEMQESPFNCVVICMDAATSRALPKPVLQWARKNVHAVDVPKVVVDESETAQGRRAAREFNAEYIVSSGTVGTAKALLEFLGHSEPRTADNHYSEQVP